MWVFLIIAINLNIWSCEMEEVVVMVEFVLGGGGGVGGVGVGVGGVGVGCVGGGGGGGGMASNWLAYNLQAVNNCVLVICLWLLWGVELLPLVGQ